MMKEPAKPKMLYLMHVPWGWIKQRPHFLAEKLTKFFSVVIGEKKVTLPGANKKLPNINTENIVIHKYYAIPLYNPLVRNNYIIDYINKLFFNLRFNLDSYKYIWVTSISGFYRIKDIIPKNAILIYDCMDDELEFPKKYDVEVLKSTEIQLIKRADFVFCTSEHLKAVIAKRTGIEKQIYISNNASSFPNEDTHLSVDNKFQIIKNSISIVYIGTIAKWFDFEIILKLLEDFVNLELFLIGPSDTDIPQHKRIHIMGTCKHNEIWGIMKMAKILIMPFVVTPLIESVNPVKLYEYIWANKPIIAPRYKEAEKFSKFVHLYKSYDELKIITDEIIRTGFSSKYHPFESEEFIKSNDWESRASEIIKVILSNDN